MKSFHVDYTPEAQKIIDKLDHAVRTRILDWIKKNLEGCENPRLHGTNLVNHPKQMIFPVKSAVTFKKLTNG